MAEKKRLYFKGLSQMQNLRQPLRFEQGGIGRARGRSVVFRPEGVYKYVERKETAVEKDH